MKRLDRAWIINFVLVAFLAALFVFLSYARVFDEFEFSTYDFRYRIRPPQKVDKDIVIIEVGDDSIEKLGKWPFPRNYHALLVKALEVSGVDTIVFDIFFSEEKEGDDQFAQAVEEAGNVYIPYVFDLVRDSRDTACTYANGYTASLIDILQKAAKGTGFVNVEPDMDGKIRRVPPFISYEGILYPHITVLVALNKLGYDFDQVRIIPEKRIIVGEDLVIPLGRSSSMLVDYPARWGEAFRHYSYVDILQSYLSDVTDQEPIVDLEELRGSICFIGVTATASPDAHPSPMEPLYPGVGVHTSVYNGIMERTFLRRLDRWWNILILLAMWLITAHITKKIRKRFSLVSILLIMVFYIALSILFFWPLGIWIDVFYPLITIAGIYVIFTFKKYVTEMQKREIIERELNIAKDIQRSFLPSNIPEIVGIKINTSMITAHQVGGDLYDIVQLDDTRLGVMLGDVSGKGVPAALYMGKVVSVFKSIFRDGSPGKVVKDMNDRLVAETTSNLFVTLTYMIFDTAAHTVTFAIGGHLPTLLIEPDGNLELLDVEEGMPLGMIECGFSESTRAYKPGSIFVLYSDGVTEAMNRNEEMFGQERLVQLAGKLKGASAEEIVEAIQKAVLDFAGKAEQHDDITVMAIHT